MPDTPKIELPKGGGAIRGIGEKFQANPVTGTGSFSVPIAMSEGRGGFTPALALSYNSGSGNSPYGLGWSIGLPSISRKTQQQLPQYQDGDDSDTFLMSGAEDLVPTLKNVSGNWVKDTYPATGYEVFRYRPRIEGLFARIEKWVSTANGDIHWKSVTRDNISTIYGKTPLGRIFDPQNPTRVFQWLIEESWDSKGNAIKYEYLSETDENVANTLHEKNRIGASSYAQRYLKKVLYGNTIMQSHANYGITDWCFKLVFDYGDHDETSPTETPSQNWSARQDPFSSYRSGFEIRTWRLCERILMFHDFAEVGGSSLVKSTQLTYDQNPIATQLTRVSHSGYKPGETADLPPLDFQYTQAEMDDTLRNFDLEDLENLPGGIDGQEYLWTDLYGEGIKGVLTQSGDGWFYKRNEGDEGYYYDYPVNTPPEPDIRFGAQNVVGPKPSIGNVQQVADFNGDGKTELLVRSENLVGYFTLDTNGEWGRFKHLENVPLVDWNDPQLKLIDLNGDGVPDVLISQGNCFTYYPSEKDQGYQERQEIAHFLDEEQGPKLVFADAEQVIHLADMSGDGLTDLVRIRNGEVCYWPNLGHGHFGKRVNMPNAPHFDYPEVFSRQRIRLIDMDGSGTTDVVYIGNSTISYWNNQSGNSFSLDMEIYHFPKVDNVASVSVMDLFGKGTSCLVWSSPMPGDEPYRIKYIDLFGQKPYLLKEVNNNMGAVSRYHYAPSTKFYLRDRQEGTPWITKLPFPVQVVERTEQYDQITGLRFVSRYAYHHGYFDHHEKEFRGFGMVEQWDTEQYEKFGIAGLFQVGSNALDEDSHIPPVHTKSWFHQGFWEQEGGVTEQFKSEYYDLDNAAWELPDSQLPTGLSAEETRQAMRALKGQILRSEVYADDNTSASEHPYTVSTSNYLVKQIQPLEENEYASFQVIPQESLSYQYERNPADPRISHSLALTTDSYGQVTQSAAVAYPRRNSGHPTQQSKGLITYTENTIINIDDDLTYNFYRLGVPERIVNYELTGANMGSLLSKSGLATDIGNASAINYEATPTSGLQKRRIGEQSILYWNEALSSDLSSGEVASHALPYKTFRLALTTGLVNDAFNNDGTTRVTASLLTGQAKYVKTGDDYWVQSDLMTFNPNHFYRIDEVNHIFGGTTQFSYDSYNLFSTQTEDALGNQTSAVIDYRFLTPKESTDLNSNRQQVDFDALGMVKAVAVMGKTTETLGDTLANPTQQFSYDLFNWMNNSKPNWAKTEAREEHSGTPTWMVSYEYTGGLGQSILKKVQAETGKAYQRDGNNELVLDGNGAPILQTYTSRWVGTGRTIFNNKGKPVKQYEPYFSSISGFEDEDEVRLYGVTPVAHYDPLGRVMRTDMPDGTYTKVEFDCWKQKSYDQNDTAYGTQWYVEQGNPSVTGSEPTAQNERAAWLAAKHYDTPQVSHLDVLGRTFLTQDDNGTYDGTTTTHDYLDVSVEFDIEGKRRVVTNALEQATDFTYSILPLNKEGQGEILFTDSTDGGWRRALTYVDGQSLMAWSERGFRLTSEYDVLRRPLKSFVNDGSTDYMVQYTLYGDNGSMNTPEDKNLRGQAVRVLDQSGLVRNLQFDFKGNLLATNRELAKVYDQTIDWGDCEPFEDPEELDMFLADEELLEGEAFAMATTYDALNRPTLITQPDGSQHQPGYNKAGMLEAMDVQLQHENGFTQYVANIDYDEKGQRTKIEYGNGATTTYKYDDETFRLIQLHTSRSSGTQIMQDLNYQYDAMGNITYIRDNAQQTHYFSNSVISPEGQYEYDALYRLKKATGREKTSLSAPGSSGHSPSGISTGGKSSDVFSTYCEKYQYDALGNMLEVSHRGTCSGAEQWKRTYVYNANTPNNYLLSAYTGSTPPSSPQFSYDVHGNLLEMPHLDALTWDFMDQLKSTIRSNEATHYVYSGGERIRKVVKDTSGGGDKLKYERIYLGGYELYRKYNTSESLILERETHHVNDDKRKIAILEVKTDDNGPISNSNRVTITRYQFTNHIDSASLELDHNAKTLSYEEYHPFGSTSYCMHTNDAEVSLKRYKYVHKERDEETGLYYYGARYYAPWLCRFVSVDPLKDKYPFYSSYQYAGNKPITFIDLDGMEEGTSSYEIVDPSITYGEQLVAPQDQLSTVPDPNLESRAQYEMENLPFTINADGNFVYTLPNGKDVVISDGDKVTKLGKDGSLWDYEINGVKYNWRPFKGEAEEITAKIPEGGQNAYVGVPNNLTYAGDENPVNAKTPEIQGDDGKMKPKYDYSLRPKSLIDYFALQHDLEYDDAGLEGKDGVNSIESSEANWNLIKGAQLTIKLYEMGAIDPFTEEAISFKTYTDAVIIRDTFLGIEAKNHTVEGYKKTKKAVEDSVNDMVDSINGRMEKSKREWNRAWRDAKNWLNWSVSNSWF